MEHALSMGYMSSPWDTCPLYEKGVWGQNASIGVWGQNASIGVWGQNAPTYTVNAHPCVRLRLTSPLTPKGAERSERAMLEMMDSTSFMT